MHKTRKSTEINTEITHKLELSYKDFKAAIIKRLHKVRAKNLATNAKMVSARNRRYKKTQKF